MSHSQPLVNSCFLEEYLIYDMVSLIYLFRLVFPIFLAIYPASWLIMWVFRDPSCFRLFSTRILICFITKYSNLNSVHGIFMFLVNLLIVFDKSTSCFSINKNIQDFFITFRTSLISLPRSGQLQTLLARDAKDRNFKLNNIYSNSATWFVQFFLL